MSEERKMATVRKVSAIEAHPNADRLDIATIDGWKCVVRKGEFSVGETILYLEVDSWVPNAVAPFLTSEGKNPRVYKDISGERLRTVKLRGQVSQGLVLPYSVLGGDAEIGEDVSERLGIIKWERELPASLRGFAKGTFPSYIKKTDQERIQNCPWMLGDLQKRWEVSVKLDGSSCTYYVKDGEVGVCSRNIDLKLDETNDDNAFVKTAKQLGYLDALHAYWQHSGENVAIQGELTGPKLNGNREGFGEHRYFVFDIWDIDDQAYVSPPERHAILAELKALGAQVEHVPFERTTGINGTRLSNVFSGPVSVSDVVDWANQTPSINNPIAEGLVFKSWCGKDSFKVISERYLLKEED